MMKIFKNKCPTYTNQEKTFRTFAPLCSVVDFQLEQNKKNFVEVHPMNIPPSLVWISLDVLRGRSKCEKFTDDTTYAK